MRAAEMLPDDTNQLILNGIPVRKGSVGAFLANARVLLDPASEAAARSEAEKDLIELVPALRALGLFEVMQIKDERLRALVDAR